MYEELYGQNRGLLEALARRYARACRLDRAVSVEDLAQAGFFGLVRAAETYDELLGKRWVDWAAWHIRHEFDRALGLRRGRFTQAHTGADTLDRPLGDEEADTALDLLADDSRPGPEEALLLEELRRGVREAVERLGDERQRRVVQLCRLEGRSYREAAEDLGISVRRAYRCWDGASVALARDRRLRALAGLDERTRFHAHKGVAAFNRDWTSVTEGAALWRIEQRARMQAQRGTEGGA